MPVTGMATSRTTRASSAPGRGVKFTSSAEWDVDYAGGSSTSAREAVVAAGHRIGFPREESEKVCIAMDERYIVNEWQLQYLGSGDWKELGAPLGLSTAVMHRFNKEARSMDYQRRKSSTAATPDAAATAAQRHWERASVDHRHTGHWHSPPQYARHTRQQSAYNDHQRQPLVHDHGDEDVIFLDRESPRSRPSMKPPRSRLLVNTRTGLLSKVASFIDWCIPFDHQVTFRRGLLHAKNGQDLKDITSCHAEMYLLVFSLLLGCILSLWDKVPDKWAQQQEGEMWSFILAGYYAFAGICAQVCLIAIMYSVVQLTIGRSVSATHFKTWYLMQTKFMQTAEWSAVIALYTFVALLNMRLHFDIHSVCPRYKWLAHCVMLLVVVAICVQLMFEVNFISRTTFHASFGADAEFHTPVDSAPLEEVEKRWYKECFEQMNPSEEATIKALMKTCLDIDLQDDDDEDVPASENGAGKKDGAGEGSVRTLTGCSRRSEI